MHVGVQGYPVLNGHAQVILGKETESQGEYNAVPQGAADEEHDSPEEEGKRQVLLLMGEKSRLDELPDLVDDIREGDKRSGPERYLKMHHELGGDVDVYDLHVERRVGKPASGLSAQ